MRLGNKIPHVAAIFHLRDRESIAVDALQALARWRGDMFWRDLCSVVREDVVDARTIAAARAVDFAESPGAMWETII